MWRALLQCVQLMTQNHNFGFKPRSRLEAVAQHAHQQDSNCDHQPQLCCDSSTAATLPDGVFGSDRSHLKRTGITPVALAAVNSPTNKIKRVSASLANRLIAVP